MKILQVHSFLYPHIGGSETYVLELSKWLKKRGHEVLIVTSLLSGLPAATAAQAGDQRNEVIEGVDVLRLPGIYLPKVPYFLFTPELFRILLRNSNLPLPLQRRGGFDIIHSHARFFFSTNCVALLRRIRKRSRFVLTLHSTRPQTQLTFLKCFEKLYEKTVGRFTVNSADCIIALDENVKQHVLSYGALRKKIVTIPNGVDTEIFAPAPYQEKARPFTVGYVGRLMHQKGIKYLIQGIKKLVPRYNFQLLIVGDGPSKTELQALCSELFLNKYISFEGALDKKLIPDFLRSIDVLVLPSLSEGMPTVVLEAMACGKAVIATDVGATSTVIDSPDVGILVPPKDPSAISQALERLMTDELLRMQMGKNARKKILSNYSWDAIVPQIEEVYLKVIRDG